MNSVRRDRRTNAFTAAFFAMTAALIVCAFAGFSFGQGNDAAAIVAAKAEPSVAAIAVSRSEWHKKLGLVTGQEEPGKLGGFDPFAFSRIETFRFGIQVGDDDLAYKTKRRAMQLKLDLADPQHVPESFGTGFVIDAKGLILTNYHVVQDAVKVFVRLPDRKGSYADIWAADPRSDLAVLKLIDDVGPLTPLPLGNADSVRRGQTVVALSNPFAAGAYDGTPSVSVGVVSNLKRRVPGRPSVRESNNANPLYQYGILLQTDARLPLGSSGAPLLNLDGECIAIANSLAAMAGADTTGGFALPITPLFKRVIETLRRGEEVEYGYLGISLDEAPPPQPGVLVSNAQRGSPAHVDANLQRGDAIIAVDGHPVRDSHELLLALGLHLAGDRVALTVKRGGFGRETKVEATLAKYNVLGKKISSSLGSRPYVGGLRVDYTSVLNQKSFTEVPSGVLVSDVQPGSKAEKARLFPGDIIQVVGVTPVANPAAFYRALDRNPGPVEFVVQRPGQPVPVRVTW